MGKSNLNTSLFFNSGAVGSGFYGGGTICKPDDDTFFCKLSRFFNEVHMIVILGILAYFAYTYFFKGKGKSLKFKKFLLVILFFSNNLELVFEIIKQLATSKSIVF